jgi:phage shock protein PspC (stress-responsive transcriptional regulator)
MKPIINIIDHVRDFFEHSMFGVCSHLGEKLGVASSRIRLYFVYSSLLTLGSPVLFYLIYAFWLNIKKYVRSQTNILWE